MVHWFIFGVQKLIEISWVLVARFVAKLDNLESVFLDEFLQYQEA